MQEKDTWLINLPHAGGSTTVYKGWNKKVKCTVLNIEYPGHWTRMKEPLLQTFEELAKDVILTIESKVPANSKLCLFGHSVGAIMIWYISPILKSKGYTIKKLFLSASQNPGLFPEKSILKSASDEEMLRLVGYNAKEHPEKINRQFMQTFFPVLKNDIQVCKSFRCDGHYVDVDAVVLYGTEDIFTNIVEMKKWNQYVKMKEMRAFPGEHLFIEDQDNVEKIIRMINECL